MHQLLVSGVLIHPGGVTSVLGVELRFFASAVLIPTAMFAGGAAKSLG